MCDTLLVQKTIKRDMGSLLLSVWSIVVVSMSLGIAWSQTATSISSGSTAIGSETSGTPSGTTFTLITDRPYSAEQVTELKQTLRDGTHICQRLQKTILYRDSRGKMRSERTIFRFDNGVSRPGPWRTEINDPVTGFRYILDEQSHSVNRSKLIVKKEEYSGMTGAKPATPEYPGQDISQQALGARAIHGISAEGKRIAVTYRAGVIGNDRPIRIVSETWFSKAFRLLLSSKVTDPRNGEMITTLVSLKLSEPDPSLFEIPSAYSFIDSQ